MSSLGPQALGQRDNQPFLGRDIRSEPDHSDAVAAQIDAEVRKFIDEGFDRAKSTLTKNRKLLDAIAERLIEVETIESGDLETLLAGVPASKGERGRLLEQTQAPARKAAKSRRVRPKPEAGLSPA
jgi:ATP-dependent Zn protease